MREQLTPIFFDEIQLAILKRMLNNDPLNAAEFREMIHILKQIEAGENKK